MRMGLDFGFSSMFISMCIIPHLNPDNYDPIMTIIMNNTKEPYLPSVDLSVCY